MRLPSRRSFLKRLFAVIPAWPILRPMSRLLASEEDAFLPTLTALAEVVLPEAELGAERIALAVQDFERWSDGFEPDAELDHPYLWSDELRYGPPDPRPRWMAQLEALEIESMRRHTTSFGDLDHDRRLELLRRQLPEEIPQRLPHAGEAQHVAVALAAWFFSSPPANDLCYEAAIGRHECRGLPSVVDEPAALPRRKARQTSSGAGGPA